MTSGKYSGHSRLPCTSTILKLHVTAKETIMERADLKTELIFLQHRLFLVKKVKTAADMKTG